MVCWYIVCFQPIVGMLIIYYVHDYYDGFKISELEAI